jgi:hypothetical protein
MEEYKKGLEKDRARRLGLADGGEKSDKKRKRSSKDKKKSKQKKSSKDKKVIKPL